MSLRTKRAQHDARHREGAKAPVDTPALVSTRRPGGSEVSRPPSEGRPLRVLALIESATVTGPAKNLIDFCRRGRQPDTDSDRLPRVESSIVTFHRATKSTATGPSAGRAGAGYPAASGPSPGHATTGGAAAVAGLAESGSAGAFVLEARRAGARVDVIEERFRFDPAVFSRLRELVERRAPDIIQTHNIKSHFLVMASGLRKIAPWVAFHHGYTTTDLKMRLYNKLDRWSLPAADSVITVSRALARELERTGVPPDKIRVVHNAVRLDRLEPRAEDRLRLRRELGIASDERIILSVGRLSREKAQVDLVYALLQLHLARPHRKFRLLIAGEGPERPLIERTARSLGLEGQVVLLGQVAGVEALYAIADVVALPSLSEGSPNVLLEAMAAGVPVVATAVGGVPEVVVHEESALLVEAGARFAMASAIGLLLENKDLSSRLAANARVALDRHSPNARVNSLLEIYRELISGSAAAGRLAPTVEWSSTLNYE